MANRLEEALLQVADVLDRHGVGFAVTGSFALAYHGVVRATLDVDLKVVADAYAARRPEVIADLEARDFVVLDDTSFRYGNVFDVELYPIHDAIDREAYARCLEDRLLPSSERVFRIVRAEDLVLIKLREHQRVHDYKHIDDVRKLLAARRLQGDGLDVAYLEARVAQHGFQALWKRWVEPAGP